MYCVACGLLLPQEAKFCPRCGKRNGTEEISIADTSLDSAIDGETHVSSSSGRRDGESNAETAQQASLHEARGNGQSVTGAQTPDSAEPIASNEQKIEKLKSGVRYANAGSITLGLAALTCLVLGAVQGFIPIFLMIGVAFAGMAWLCAARWPRSQSLHALVLPTALILAGFVGVALDQDVLGPRYRYFSKGSTQYRTDEGSGRTDRLGSHGWYPVAFDKPAQEIEGLDAARIDLINGKWSHKDPYLPYTQPNLRFDGICFDVVNSSDFTIDRIVLDIEIDKKNNGGTGNNEPSKESSETQSQTSQQVVITGFGGNLIAVGSTDQACAASPRDLADDEGWNYKIVHVYGWKK